MQQKGSVSLWVGRADSGQALDDYVEETHPPEGGYLSSFARDFRIRYYDEDFREAEVLVEPASGIRQMLDGFSYAEIVGPRFEQHYGKPLPCGLNAVVLIYNFSYGVEVEEARTPLLRLHFVGVSSYLP